MIVADVKCMRRGESSVDVPSVSMARSSLKMNLGGFETATPAPQSTGCPASGIVRSPVIEQLSICELYCIGLIT
jgi:hypothetical protein